MRDVISIDKTLMTPAPEILHIKYVQHQFFYIFYISIQIGLHQLQANSLIGDKR